MTGNVTRIYISPSGSVGIGTTSPQSALQVTGNYLQIPNYSGSAPLASDCDQPAEAGRMAIYTPNTGAPTTSYLYICPQGGGWVAK